MKPNAKFESVPTEALLPFLLELIEEGKTVNLTVTGYSMMPFLFNGRDSVLLKKPEKLCRYDVVLYLRDDGKAILHRIIQCPRDGYMIVGDNQNEVDGPVTRENIKAVAVGFYRNGCYVSAKTWWCRLYGFFWGGFRRFRRLMFPLIGFGSRVIKRIERLRKKNEVDY